MANDFLVFGGGAGANVLTQAAWAALGARTAGFTSGVAQSAQLNKAWRQSSIMAAVLAQFISDQTGQDSVDDGTTATLLANLKKASPGRLLRVTVYTIIGGLQQVSVDGAAFTTSGASTFTPRSDTTSVIVEQIAGGGGSGGSSATGAGTISVSGGGGSGAYARSRYSSGFTGVAVTIGAGGAAGAAGAGNGGTGGTTSFGALLSCAGGGGSGGRGAFAPSNISLPGGGANLPANGNIVRSRGKDGGNGFTISLGDFVSGVGGDTPFGPGATAVNATGVGQTATTYGAGAGGAATGISAAAQAGGAGAPGVVIVYEYA